VSVIATPRLSIVVPFFNVERYVRACLESLQRQSFGDFEVVLVDDGSLDGTADIAREFCTADSRFRMVRQDNAGLGPARNTGVAEAHGEYLAFVDSDDLVPRRSYEMLVGSLDSSGSDLAAGDARRFNDLGIRQSYVHREPFAKDRPSTHVREFPLLALDRMAWNKLYRRSFWDRSDLAFPPIMYEDYPVTIRSHVWAGAVDVVGTPVYYWRERAGGELSITQRRWEVANLRDRVDSAGRVLDFLAAEAPELLPIVEQHLLHIDVSAVAAALHGARREEEPTVLSLARQLLSRMSEQSRERVIPFERVQNHLLDSGDTEAVKELISYRAEFGTEAAVRRTGRFRPRFHYQLPFLGDAGVGVPEALYRLERADIELVTRVESAKWRGRNLDLELTAHLSALPMDDSSSVLVWLTGPGGRRIDLDVRRHAARHRHYGSGLVGALVSIDVDALAGYASGPGFWALYAQVRSCGLTRSGLVERPGPGRARWPVTRAVGPDGMWAHADVVRGGYGVLVRHPDTAVTASRVEGSDIVLTGHYTADFFVPDPTLQLRLYGGALRRSFAATASRGEGRAHGFEVRVAMPELVAHDHDDPVEERSMWICRLLLGEESLALAMGPGGADSAGALNGRRISASASVHGNLMVIEAHAHPLVHTVNWRDATTLLGSGRHDRSDPLPGTAVMRRYVTPADRVDVEVPVMTDGADFSFEVDVTELVRRAKEVRTHTEGHGITPWQLLFDMAGEADHVVVDRGRLADLAAAREVEGHHVRVDIGRAERLLVIVD